MEQSSDTADLSMEQSSDGRWLSYPELAAVRGIDKPSAIRLASRQKWRRQRDNRRVVRVLVPSEWLAPRYQSVDQPMDRPEVALDLSSDRTDFSAALAAIQAAHAGEVAALHGQVAGLKTLADRTLEQLAEATTEVGKLRDRLDAAETRARSAEQSVAERRQADDERKARGRWARLRAAWRGE